MFASWMVRLYVVLVLVFWHVLALAQPGSRFHFIENKGQWPSNVEFASRIAGGSLVLEKGRWTFSFLDEQRIQALHERGHHTFRESNAPSLSNECIDGRVIRLSLVGSNTAAMGHPFGKIATTFNYFLGNDPARWGSKSQAFEGILYTDVYPGIDARIAYQGDKLKYDFILAPGADPGRIAVAYEGAESIVTDHGNLSVISPIGSFTEMQPMAWQFITGNKVFVKCEYVLQDETVTYRFPNGYDPCYPLTIDPLLIFSTYSGSTADNWGSTATPGENGTLYSSGVTEEYTTLGGHFPATPGAFQTTNGGLYDVAILKYDSAGGNLLYASYLGGNFNDSPHSLVMNSQKELIVLGTTSSDNFPTTSGAIGATFSGGTLEYNVFDYDNGSDIFVARISSDGSTLLASTLIGGSANDGLNPSGGLLVRNYGDQLRGDVITDDQGNIFISTVTSSSDFPAKNSFNTTYRGGDTDAVLMKLNSSLTTIIWSALLGGNGSDASHTIKLDQEGNIYVAGGTGSFDFPVSGGCYQNVHQGDADGWIAHIAGDGSSVLSSTFTGTAGFNQIYFLDLNKDEEVYVYGQTVSGFPVTSGVYSNPNSGQFIQKFDKQLSTLLFSTVFGSGRGIPDISPTAFLVNDCNNLYATGWGGVLNQAEGFWNSNTFGMPVTANAFQKTTHGSDFYFIVLTDDASRFLYGTYMGGADSRTHVDGGTSRFDKKGVVYHAVCSGCWAFNELGHSTSDFPTTPNSHSRVNNSKNCNNAAFKFDLSSLHAILQTNSVHLNMPGFNKVCIPDKIVFQNFSTGGQIFEWSLGDSPAFTRPDTSQIVHQYKNPGKYTIKLKAIDATTCTGIDSTSATIDVWIPQGTANNDETICYGESIQLAGSGGIAYQWKSEDGTQTSSEEIWPVSPKDTTVYFVTITDNHGCIKKDTVKISVVPGVDLKFALSKYYDCLTRPSVAVKNLTDPKEEVFFDFGDGTTSNQQQEVHRFAADGTYSVRLVATRDGCTYENALEVPVYELKVPNVITPDATPSINDNFVILYGGKPINESSLKATVLIYNRWGKEVFHAEDYQGEWSAVNVAGGVYYYEVDVVGETLCKGWIHVIK